MTCYTLHRQFLLLEGKENLFMYSKVYSAGLNGLEAQKIIVEADVEIR